MLSEDSERTSETSKRFYDPAYKFDIVSLFFYESVPKKRIAAQTGLPLQTVRRWCKQYEEGGIGALWPKQYRADVRRDLKRPEDYNKDYYINYLERQVEILKKAQALARRICGQRIR